MCTDELNLPVSTPQVRSKDVTIVTQASVLMSNPIYRMMFAVGVQNLSSRFFVSLFLFWHLYADDQHLYTLAN